MGVRQPHGTALTYGLVDDMLWRHVLGIHVFMNVQNHKMVRLSAERIFRMKLGTLDKDEVVRKGYGVDSGDLVVIGQAEEIVAMRHITVQTFLG